MILEFDPASAFGLIVRLVMFLRPARGLRSIRGEVRFLFPPTTVTLMSEFLMAEAVPFVLFVSRRTEWLPAELRGAEAAFDEVSMRME